MTPSTIYEMFLNFKQVNTPFVHGYSVDQAFCLTLLQQLLSQGAETKLWDVIADAFIPEDTLGYYMTVELKGVPFEVAVLLTIRRNQEALGSDDGSEELDITDIECRCFVYPEGSAIYVSQVKVSKTDMWSPAAVTAALAYNASLSVTH